MIFNFKTLQYQSDAVQSIVDVFKGQPFHNAIKHVHDIGNQTGIQSKIDPETGLPNVDVFAAYRNEEVLISSADILKNIQNIQRSRNIPISDKIENPLGAVTIDIEMETGTGKTYVYTKAMYELNKIYGWNKFIVVVPSIAIRQGVKQSIDNTASHFHEIYGKPMQSFIYESSRLGRIDQYSQSPDIYVMIINSQAFNAFSEDNSSEESRIIHSIRDEFGSRCPMDVIASNHPIIIQDEPQKLGSDGSKTQDALRNHFNALFSLNFSATHMDRHNLVYSLDPLDAFNMKLVKKIVVKGVDVNHLTGSEKYIYFEGAVITPSGPKFRLEINVNRSNGIKKETHIFSKKDNLYDASNHVESYKGLFISDYNQNANALSFSDGTTVHAGESIGDVSESNKRRIQIRETIHSHLDKESKLFHQGVKVLSLFFIDKVAKYRSYDDSGMPIKGEYAKMFEEEFNSIIKEQGNFYDQDYIAHLTKTNVESIHSGYFSIDKKGHMIDYVKGQSTESNDVSAYALILENKERLLSFDEPVRFIFSHSALSEGWDNPNVFQICALKHSLSNPKRRQEVGRGMRICVDQSGNRLDFDTLGPRFHDVNSLTVIADEDYQSFVKGLQDDIAKETRIRAIALRADTLEGKKIFVEGGEFIIDSGEAKILYKYLIKNDYIGEKDDLPTEKLKKAIEIGKLDSLPLDFIDKEEGLLKLLKKLACPQSIRDICEDGRKPKILSNNLNQNFNKKEFLELWNEINHVYHYKVSFDSEELIRNAKKRINSDLKVATISGTVTTIEQKSEATYDQIINRDGFGKAQTHIEEITITSNDIKYDLIGRVAANTGLTRRTIARILYDIDNRQFDLFKLNPEEFIEKISKLINEEKSSIVVNHIEYSMTDEKFDSNIFTMNRPEGDFDKAYRAVKNVQDYVFTDSKVEREFAEALDGAQEVVVYAKLPDGKGGFCIPTPMGDYTPDWAIAFQKGTVRHIYFVAETKGSMSSLEISRIQQAKIDCVKRLFDNVGIKVGFGKVASYSDLLTAVRGE